MNSHLILLFVATKLDIVQCEHKLKKTKNYCKCFYKLINNLSQNSKDAQKQFGHILACSHSHLKFKARSNNLECINAAPCAKVSF